MRVNITTLHYTTSRQSHKCNTSYINHDVCTEQLLVLGIRKVVMTIGGIYLSGIDFENSTVVFTQCYVCA